MSVLRFLFCVEALAISQLASARGKISLIGLSWPEIDDHLTDFCGKILAIHEVEKITGTAQHIRTCAKINGLQVLRNPYEIKRGIYDRFLVEAGWGRSPCIDTRVKDGADYNEDAEAYDVEVFISEKRCN